MMLKVKKNKYAQIRLSESKLTTSQIIFDYL